MTDILQRLRCTVPCQDMTAKAGCHCAEAADTITRLTARVEELEGALGNLIKACDQGRIVPRSGVSGMTIEAQMRNSVLNGVPMWPVEEAREVWEQTRAAIPKGERK